jgi:hypothetical protein
MGIIRKAPRGVIFDTAQYAGLGIEHLADYQGHSHLQMQLYRKYARTGYWEVIRCHLD